MTDALGAIRVSYEYDPYGRQTRLSESVICDLGFTGFLSERSAGLCAAAYRFYDPEVGR